MKYLLHLNYGLQDYGYENAKKGIANSLKALDTDYIDLYLLHQPYGDYLGAWKALEDSRLLRER